MKIISRIILTIAVGMIFKLTVGIDAGTHTGIAIYDPRAHKIIETYSTDFFGAFRFLKNLDRGKYNVVVEVPSDFIYKRNDGEKGMSRDKMAILIGGNRREAQLMAAGCKILGFTVKEVLPVRAAKWTADQLKRELGYTARTNEHVRDACRLAYYHSSVFLRG